MFSPCTVMSHSALARCMHDCLLETLLLCFLTFFFLIIILVALGTTSLARSSSIIISMANISKTYTKKKMI